MPAPSKLNYHREQAVLQITWPDQLTAELSAEFLRVHSPSAEVRGHGVGQDVLQTGKKDVAVSAIEPAGRYAVKITFDDGHDSGLYDWNYLRSLCENQDTLWQSYLQKLQQAGASREPQLIKIKQL